MSWSMSESRGDGGGGRVGVNEAWAAGVSVRARRGWALVRAFAHPLTPPKTPPQEPHPGDLQDTGGKIGSGWNRSRNPEGSENAAGRGCPEARKVDWGRI